MIRTAVKEDIPALLLIGWTFYQSGPFAQHGLNYDPETLSRVIESMIEDSQNSLILIAEKRNQIAGTLGAKVSPWFLDDSQLQVFEMWWWVEPWARSEGVAQALLNELEWRAKKRGAVCVKMASLPNEYQDRLDKFYKVNGYKQADHFWTKEL